MLVKRGSNLQTSIKQHVNRPRRLAGVSFIIHSSFVSAERKSEPRPALPPSDVNVNETIRQILELAIDRKSHQTSGLYRQGAHHNNNSSHPKSKTSNSPPAKSFLMVRITYLIRPTCDKRSVSQTCKLSWIL